MLTGCMSVGVTMYVVETPTIDFPCMTDKTTLQPTQGSCFGSSPPRRAVLSDFLGFTSCTFFCHSPVPDMERLLVRFDAWG